MLIILVERRLPGTHWLACLAETVSPRPRGGPYLRNQGGYPQGMTLDVVFWSADVCVCDYAHACMYSYVFMCVSVYAIVYVHASMYVCVFECVQTGECIYANVYI